MTSASSKAGNADVLTVGERMVVDLEDLSSHHLLEVVTNSEEVRWASSTSVIVLISIAAS